MNLYPYPRDLASQAAYNKFYFSEYLQNLAEHPNTTKPDLGSKTWSEREEIASQFSSIDFGCKHTGCGCAGHPNDAKGCCVGCANSHAYIHTFNPEDREYLIQNFDGNTGFWREGVGCILPHSKRSTTCLSYRCDPAAKNSPRAFLLPWLKEVSRAADRNGHSLHRHMRMTFVTHAKHESS